MAEPWTNTRKTLSKLQQLLLCSNCSQPLNNPYYLESCSHTFCKLCIDGEKCPECNIPVQARQITPNRLLSNVLLLTQQLQDILDNNVSALEKTEINESTTGSTHQSTPVSSKVKSSRINASTKRSSHVSSLEKAEMCEMRPGAPSLHREKDENPSKSPSHHHSACSSPVERKLPAALLKVKNSSSPITPSSGSDKKNSKGETPLHVACIKGDVAKVKCLLKDGANPNVKDNAGWTPLHEASHHNFVNIVALLLKFGALINTPGYDNETSLHDAVQMNCLQVVTFLVRNGADIDARNARGMTPMDLAKTKEIQNALQSTVSLCFKKIDLNSSPAAVRTVIQSPQQIVLLCTGLNRKQKQALESCMVMMKFVVVEELGEKVTHIVTDCNDNGQCTRTLKYLQGILAGKWILNFTWIELCLEYRQKMDEEAFEVPGTKNHPNSFGAKKGRENATKQLPPLFDGCTFYFYGNLTGPWPQRSELISLVRSAGGKVLMREPRYDMKDEETSRVPYHVRHNPGLVRVNCFVVHSKDKTPLLNNLGDNVSYVHVTWLLDSISSFQLLPFDYKNLK